MYGTFIHDNIIIYPRLCGSENVILKYPTQPECSLLLKFPIFSKIYSGHGTYEENGELVSNVTGVVERVNKLIRVQPIQSRYSGDVGDVIIGRIKEVRNGKTGKK